jgi:hypothetical protein
MELSAIRDAVHKQPFQPFRLRLADGRAVTVRHPDFIAIAETGSHCGNGQTDDCFPAQVRRLVRHRPFAGGLDRIQCESRNNSTG